MAASKPITGDSDVTQMLQKTLNTLTKYEPDGLKKVTDLRGSSPAFCLQTFQSPGRRSREADDTCTLKGNESFELKNELAKSANPESYKKILQTIKEFAGQGLVSVWVSDTLHVDLDVQIKQQPLAGRTFQLLFLGENKPCFFLTLFDEETNTEDEARMFTENMSQLFSLSLLRYCPCDFVLLPCVLSFGNLSRASLEKEVKSQQQQSRDFYGGPDDLTLDAYQKMARAVTAVASGTSLPYLLHDSEDNEWLMLMDPDWHDAMSLFVEAMVNCEDVRIQWTEDTQFKATVAALEAARRLGYVEDVSFTATDKSLEKTRRALGDESKGLSVSVSEASDISWDIYISTSKCTITISGECFRLLLLGKTGNGKSASGNTIFDEDVFHVNHSLSSDPGKPKLEHRKLKGRFIEIMDCPGLYDTADNDTVCKDIVTAVVGMHPGPHAILLVLKVGRFTDEEFSVFEKLKALFDDHITDHMIVLFTHGDRMEAENSTFEDLKSEAPANLCQVLEECGERCVLFNNRAGGKKSQVEDLFEKVRHLKAENNGKPYVCPKYQEISHGLEEEIGAILRAWKSGDHEESMPDEPEFEDPELPKGENSANAKYMVKMSAQKDAEMFRYQRKNKIISHEQNPIFKRLVRMCKQILQSLRFNSEQTMAEGDPWSS